MLFFPDVESRGLVFGTDSTHGWIYGVAEFCFLQPYEKELAM